MLAAMARVVHLDSEGAPKKPISIPKRKSRDRIAKILKNQLLKSVFLS